jgi:hypothetical protein
LRSSSLRVRCEGSEQHSTNSPAGADRQIGARADLHCVARVVTRGSRREQVGPRTPPVRPSQGSQRGSQRVPVGYEPSRTRAAAVPLVTCIPAVSHALARTPRSALQAGGRGRARSCQIAYGTERISGHPRSTSRVCAGPGRDRSASALPKLVMTHRSTRVLARSAMSRRPRTRSPSPAHRRLSEQCSRCGGRRARCGPDAQPSDAQLCIIGPDTTANVRLCGPGQDTCTSSGPPVSTALSRW